jgi:hypothetical protein
MIVLYYLNKLTLKLKHSRKARSNERSKYFAIISHIDNAKYIEKFIYCVHIKLALVKGATTSSPQKVIRTIPL